MAKNQYIGVNNVARKVKQPYIGVNNIARKVKNGYVGVSNIARQFYSSGTPVSSLSVGTIVKLNENGIAQNYIIVHQGNPDSSFYDASCDGTWLLRQNVFPKRAWNSTRVANFDTSTIKSYLDSTILSMYDANIQNSVIKQVKIPYVKNYTVMSGGNGLSCKIFLLSAREINGNNQVFSDGRVLSYFNTTNISSIRTANLPWWTRTTSTAKDDDDNYKESAAGINAWGEQYVWSVTSSDYLGTRPAFIINSSAIIDENMNIV